MESMNLLGLLFKIRILFVSFHILIVLNMLKNLIGCTCATTFVVQNLRYWDIFDHLTYFNLDIDKGLKSQVQVISERNKINRSKQKTAYTAGTKSFLQHKAERVIKYTSWSFILQVWFINYCCAIGSKRGKVNWTDRAK